jgi:hypothetical protein
MEVPKGNLVIFPKDRRKDRVLIGGILVFLLVWIPGTGLITYLAYLAFTEKKMADFIGFTVWLVFGYLGLILPPFTLMRRNDPEILSVKGDYLIIKRTGLLGRKTTRIHKNVIESVAFDNYAGGSEPLAHFCLSLLLKNQIWNRPVILAHFVHPEEKLQIFLDIVKLLKENGFEFKEVNKFQQEEIEKEA